MPNDKIAIQLLEEIIRLNIFDGKIKNTFGQSNDDTVLDWSISNLFEIFLSLSGFNNISDIAFDIVFDENNSENAEEIYNELLIIKNKKENE